MVLVQAREQELQRLAAEQQPLFVELDQTKHHERVQAPPSGSCELIRSRHSRTHRRSVEGLGRAVYATVLCRVLSGGAGRVQLFGVR